MQLEVLKVQSPLQASEPVQPEPMTEAHDALPRSDPSQDSAPFFVPSPQVAGALHVPVLKPVQSPLQAGVPVHPAP